MDGHKVLRSVRKPHVIGNDKQVLSFGLLEALTLRTLLFVSLELEKNRLINQRPEHFTNWNLKCNECLNSQTMNLCAWLLWNYIMIEVIIFEGILKLLRPMYPFMVVPDSEDCIMANPIMAHRTLFLEQYFTVSIVEYQTEYLRSRI